MVSHTHSTWGGGVKPRAGHARAGAHQQICDSRRGRSFDVGVKTQGPRRGTHAETLRDRQRRHKPERKSEEGQHKVSEGLGHIRTGEFTKKKLSLKVMEISSLNINIRV